MKNSICLLLLLISIDLLSQNKDSIEADFYAQQSIDALILRRCSYSNVYTTSETKTDLDISGHIIWELEGFAWSMDRNILNNTDSLNGIEQRWVVSIKAKAWRYYRVCKLAQRDHNCEKWSQWFDKPKVKIELTMTKQDRSWMTIETSAASVFKPIGKIPPTCSAIKGL